MILEIIMKFDSPLLQAFQYFVNRWWFLVYNTFLNIVVVAQGLVLLL